MRPEFAPGARNAVRTCLNISPQDRVAIVKDRVSDAIAESIEEEVRGTGAELETWTMEDLGSRPMTSMPRVLGEQILKFKPTASYFIGTPMKGELGFRKPLLKLLADELGCRHGHMIGIDDLLMTDGMAGDYEETYRVTQRVWEVARTASRIDVSSRAGTELTATFRKDWKWIPCDGRYWDQNQWGNLPEGETFTAPLSVDGVIAAVEVGDWFTPKYGLLPEPVMIRIGKGRVTGFETGDRQLRADLEAYLSQHPMSNRVGEFAIGTNVGLQRIVGNFLQDEKFPGVHIAFGDPYGFDTGADWECPSHVDVLSPHATVLVDGRKIMEDGRVLR